MKQKFFTKILVATMLFVSIANAKAGRIAVLDFNASVGITQSDVDGISAIFLTHFSPQGFTLVERTQINRVISEQGFQRSALTNQQMVRVGQILNLSHIVIGDVNIVSGRFNLDVRVVCVQTGEIVARDGTDWARASAPREPMRILAQRLAQRVPQPTAPPPPPPPRIRF